MDEKLKEYMRCERYEVIEVAKDFLDCQAATTMVMQVLMELRALDDYQMNYDLMKLKGDKKEYFCALAVEKEWVEKSKLIDKLIEKKWWK